MEFPFLGGGSKAERREMVERINENFGLRLVLIAVVLLVMIYGVPFLDRWIYPCDYFPCWQWGFGGPR
jgi:hypothetical protein